MRCLNSEFIVLLATFEMNNLLVALFPNYQVALSAFARVVLERNNYAGSKY